MSRGKGGCGKDGNGGALLWFEWALRGYGAFAWSL